MTASARRRLAAPAAALAITLTFLSAPGTAAAGVDATNWWYDRYGVPEIQAEGWTGAGVRVAVVDSQINPDLPVFQGAPLTVDQTPHCVDAPVVSGEATSDAVHGSDVTALLIGNGSVRGIAPQASVTFYGIGRDTDECGRNGFDEPSALGFAMQRAVAGGAQILSVSQGIDDLAAADADVVARALAAGVIIVAAVPNERGDNAASPADANGVVAVNAMDAGGAIQKDFADPSAPDIWVEATVVAAGVDFPSVNWEEDWRVTGSSLATPLVAGMLAVVWQKYPDATANQLVQSLIRNTTAEDHPLLRDTTGGYGYGPASLRHMLSEDPTQYEDVNPLLDKSSGEPTIEQIRSAGQPTPGASAASPSVEPTLVPESIDASSGIMGGVATATIVVVVVLVMVALAIVLLIIRRRRATTLGGGVR